MIRAVDHPGTGGVRILFAVGLVINFAGFVYDWAWHSWNLSLETIPPSKLLVVHGGIYVGSLLVAVAVGHALRRRLFTSRPERIGLLVIAAGLLLEFAGDAADMWTHSQGYEKDLYHDFVYRGAALTVLGYLLLELFQLYRSGVPEATAAPAADDDAADDDAAAGPEQIAGRSTPG
ncbi:hypothetical protein GA0074695_2752 [Micromonospora viridifaciens]|uniref:DUF2243 domain-containing protein n=1 Tax=Micromonospora viridifaciens TaxID=1881 RepID=A0A1C4WTY1_MICVI|nr:hypothetical protein [Micromonospora viridifaciens]SCE99707.1 hypothetical protein GA0074695_2752 [Micromonospora viridifaciens]